MLCDLKPRAALFFGLTITSFSLLVSAAPGELSTKPLFLGSTVPPNILFLVDDSGSMDWEVLKSAGAEAGYSDEGDFPNRDDIDITPLKTDPRRLLESCVGYNVLYYNPAVTYTPWVGVDDSGAVYQDQSITSAKLNPYLSAGETIDLTQEGKSKSGGKKGGSEKDDGSIPGYFVWRDTGGSTPNDGVFSRGECLDLSGSAVNFGYASRFVATVPGYTDVSMTADQQTNFANWFSYYRKREYVVKRALSEIISDGKSRMGLATLWNNGNVGTEIKDIDDITTPVQAAAATNKNALLKNLFKVNSEDGTPLRQTLDEAGKYFEVGTNPGDGLFGFTPNPTSPILPSDEGGACQQNFAIMLSDGYWNGDPPDVGNTDKDSNNDLSDYDGGSYEDDYSNTLADVAMKYYEKDLAPNLDNIVPETAGVDENSAQHMVSYMVAFGVNGTLSNNPSDTTSPFNWPKPESGTSTTIDDMRHAAWNGRGEFLSAQDPRALIDSLSASIASIQNRLGSATAVTFNTTSVTEDTFVYLASFDSGSWTGTLQAYEYDDDGIGSLEWDAAELMNADGYAWQARSIYTYRSDTDRGIPFMFPPDYHSRFGSVNTDNYLADSQVKDLLANAPHPVDTSDPAEQAENQDFGNKIVDYIYGDFSQESISGFRPRYGLRLADIINSNPTYVGAPSEPYPNNLEGSANLYSSYVSAQSDRREVVYVGANDGMLHAFDATNGDELFAYIPNFIFHEGDTGLHRYAEADYSHTPYVDGHIVSRDAFVGGQWRTYLVGALRAGGKGVFILDVTDPDIYLTANNTVAEKLVVTEFSHKDMGYSFSKPQIARMNNGKWAAVFGNGYNNDAGGDGTAKLFIVYLDGSGTDILKTKVGIVVNDDCLDSSSRCNGLSSPSLVDLDGNHTVDRIYAGDVQGNMWSFNVYSDSASDWATSFGDSQNPRPLFTACSSTPCTDSNRQPITAKPIAVGHPSISSAATYPNVFVVFGTGQYIAKNDNFDRSQQSFYGVWDAGAASESLTRDALIEQSITDTLGVNGDSLRTLSSNAVSYNTDTPTMGWFMDLTASGERVVVDPLVVSDYVFFVTTIPESAECSSGGTGYVMAADLRTGGQPSRQIFDRSINQSGADGNYAGFELGAVPGGGVIMSGDTLVTSDSLNRVVSTDLNTANPNKNSRRASWSIVK